MIGMAFFSCEEVAQGLDMIVELVVFHLNWRGPAESIPVDPQFLNLSRVQFPKLVISLDVDFCH
jgi:hypothetical protein